MATIDELDVEISDLHTRISTLRAHRSNLASVLLSQPHLATRLQAPNQPSKISNAARRAIQQQSQRNLENVYRACAGVTAYKVQDPDPHAINNGNILGVSIDVAVRGKFVETYHVLLNWRGEQDARVLRIHKHAIPPCIPLQQLANKWLPTTAKDVDVYPEQDLVKFGRSLRQELVSWHMRIEAIKKLREEAGLKDARVNHANKDTHVTSAGCILNALVSDDEASSDVEDEEEMGFAHIVDIESDTAVRQITVTWSDRRVAVMSITKDGRIEKAVIRTRDGGRDTVLSRKAIGSIGGLVRRLEA
jgi:central kinetochore subunit Mal2/MCM21